MISNRIMPLPIGENLWLNTTLHVQRLDGVYHYMIMLGIIHLGCFLRQQWYCFLILFIYSLALLYGLHKELHVLSLLGMRLLPCFGPLHVLINRFAFVPQDAWQCDICGSKSGRGFGMFNINPYMLHKLVCLAI